MTFSILNEIILSICIGIIQGATEFLPVSSTAHQALVSTFLTGGKPTNLEASNIIQLATVAAVIQFFWKDIVVYFSRCIQLLTSGSERKLAIQRITSWFQKENFTPHVDIELAQIAVAMIPILVLGMWLETFARQYRESLVSIAWFLLLGSLLMWLAEYIYSQRLKLKHVQTSPFSPIDTLTIGLFQVLAIFPGMSRSGSTVSGAIMLGNTRKKAVRFSFLLSIPTLIIAGILDIVRTLQGWLTNGVVLLPSQEAWTGSSIELSLVSLVVASICAYVVGYASLSWLISFLSKNTFMPFAVYRVLLALLLFGLIQFGILI